MKKKKKKETIIKLSTVQDHLKRKLKNPVFKKAYEQEMKKMKIVTKGLKKSHYTIDKVDMDYVSMCCGAYVYAEGKTTKYYACTDCQKPCKIMQI